MLSEMDLSERKASVVAAAAVDDTITAKRRRRATTGKTSSSSLTCISLFSFVIGFFINVTVTFFFEQNE